MLVASLAAFAWAIDRERDRVREQHLRVADLAAGELSQTLEGTIGGLRGLRGLHDANAKLTAEQFAIASRAVLDQHELQGTQWVMNVSRRMRSEFETVHRQPIRTPRPNGEAVPAPDADSWAAVAFVAPSTVHRRALGIDQRGVAARRVALLRSRDRGRAQVTAPNRLAVPGRPLGIQIFLPVYKGGAVPDTLGARREKLAGWVGGVYELGHLGDAITSSLPPGASVEILNDGTTLLASGDSVDRGVHRLLSLPGQTWALRASSNAAFSWATPLLALAAGLLVVVLVTLLIWQTRHREHSMMSLLSERREREAVEAALTQTEEANRTIVTSAPDGIITIDRTGRIVSVNPAAERMFRSPADEVAGKAISVLFSLPEEGVPPGSGVLGVLRRAVSSGADADLMGRRGDHEFPVEARVSSQRATGGLTLIARDVTDQRLAESEERALRTVATAVASGAAPEAVFGLVAEQAGVLYEAFGAYVARCEEGAEVLVGRWGTFQEHDVREFLADGGADCGRTAGAGQAAMVRDCTDGESVMARYGVRSAIVAPVRVEGKLWGAVGVAASTPGVFRPGSENHLERFAEFVSMAIANADARERLLAWAATDELTGLPNQRTFHDTLAAEVERAQRHGHRLSLALFDVDHFKAVNDTHGHQVGDQVLVGIAERLRGIMRASDTIARVGGEEFGWIMVETDGLGAWRAADRARSVIEETPFPEVGPVTVSGGICELSPTGSAGEIFRLADVALYWAKGHGRNVCFRYSPDVIEVLSAEERSAQMERIQRVGSIMGLARAVDAKDPSTQRHSERVAALAARLARELGWSEQSAALLHEAALVHDVGKIAVPDSVLVKSGALTPAEYDLVKAHAELGGRIVEGCLSADQAAWVRGHHERFDGLGYPDGAEGTDIPEGARILALADAWDAMTEVRLYRVALKQDEALQECIDNAGTQFWPEAVDALVRLARRGRPAPRARDDGGEPAAPLGIETGEPTDVLPGYIESQRSSDET
jgi:diguanylate cyclase (GGDEF)-like protein/PAS domain S-box-containing protein